MIIYLEQIEKQEWNIVGIPDNQGDELEVHFCVRSAQNHAPYVLSRETCSVLDKLFRQCSTLYWKNDQEMEDFIAATRKYMVYRVKVNSKKLPQAVIQLLEAEGGAAPATIEKLMRQG